MKWVLGVIVIIALVWAVGTIQNDTYVPPCMSGGYCQSQP